MFDKMKEGNGEGREGGEGGEVVVLVVVFGKCK